MVQAVIVMVQAVPKHTVCLLRVVCVSYTVLVNWLGVFIGVCATGFSEKHMQVDS